jgi:hypothetical protein
MLNKITEAGNQKNYLKIKIRAHFFVSGETPDMAMCEMTNQKFIT